MGRGVDFILRTLGNLGGFMQGSAQPDSCLSSLWLLGGGWIGDSSAEALWSPQKPRTTGHCGLYVGSRGQSVTGVGTACLMTDPFLRMVLSHMCSTSGLAVHLLSVISVCHGEAEAQEVRCPTRSHFQEVVVCFAFCPLSHTEVEMSEWHP